MQEDKLLRILKDLPLFAKNFLVIHDKSGVSRKFEFNRAQKYVHEKLEKQLKQTGMVRALILKGRQQGISTYISARFFHKVITNKGKKAFILTHLSDATKSMFDMTKRYSENLPVELFPQPDKKNDNTLMYNGLGSGYRVGTAGNENIGRSMTNQFLHLSEYAFYKKAESISLGLKQTVAYVSGTEVIEETTANGEDNVFYKEWQKAKNGRSNYIAIFAAWYWQEEYCIETAGNLILSEEEAELMEKFSYDGLTLGHIAWRRIKLEEFSGDEEQKRRRFRQEYPFTDEEAFLHSMLNTFISPECVRKARKNKVESTTPLVIGVDPTRSEGKNGDKTAIIRRRGRKAYGLETYYISDTTEIVERLINIIDEENPSAVYIDAIGIGGPIVDRLKSMGYSMVEGVIVSKNATEIERYANRRAELWDKMREWLTQDLPVEIPDDDDLEKDLTGLLEEKDIRRRLLMESKEKAKLRSIDSPDRADSLMLTFHGGEYANDYGYKVNILPEKHRGMLI